MSEIKYKYLSAEDEVQQVYKLMSMREIHQWTGAPLFPPMIRKLAKKHEIIVAMDGEVLAGFIQFKLKKDAYNIIHYHCVHPDYQRRGIALKLSSFVPYPRLAKCKVGNAKIQNLYIRLGMKLAKIETRSSTRNSKSHIYQVAVYTD